PLDDAADIDDDELQLRWYVVVVAGNPRRFVGELHAGPADHPARLRLCCTFDFVFKASEAIDARCVDNRWQLYFITHHYLHPLDAGDPSGGGFPLKGTIISLIS